MAKIILSNCKELTSAEYCDLSEKIDLEFKGQTRANSEGIYWTVWGSKEKLFKIKCSLNY